MGVVFKTEDTKLHRFFSLKFLPEELSRNRHALERFEREAQGPVGVDTPLPPAIFSANLLRRGAKILAELVVAIHYEKLLAAQESRRPRGIS